MACQGPVDNNYLHDTIKNSQIVQNYFKDFFPYGTVILFSYVSIIQSNWWYTYFVLTIPLIKDDKMASFPKKLVSQKQKGLQPLSLSDCYFPQDLLLVKGSFAGLATYNATYVLT